MESLPIVGKNYRFADLRACTAPRNSCARQPKTANTAKYVTPAATTAPAARTSLLIHADCICAQLMANPASIPQSTAPSIAAAKNVRAK